MWRNRLVLPGAGPRVRCAPLARALELREQVAQSAAEQATPSSPTGQAGQQAAEPAAARRLAASHATSCSASQDLVQSETRRARAAGTGRRGLCGRVAEPLYSLVGQQAQQGHGDG